MMRRVKLKVKTFLWWVLAMICAYVLVTLPSQLSLNEIDDRDKCPSCYGTNLCPAFQRGEVALTNWTRYSVSRMFNAKNTFFASYKGAPVFLKKLAHEFELKKLDVEICDGGCEHVAVGQSMKLLAIDSSVIKPHDLRRTLDFQKLKDKAWTEVLSCIQSQELLDWLILRAQHHESNTSLENILTMLMVNPEPLILMAFPASEGWPFPKYFGSCGRLAMVGWAGKMLTQFWQESFTIRARLALQLLQIAQKFSENPSGISLYLTDWSPDNFAVDNVGRLRVIDAENIILVNQSIQSGPGWNTPHVSVGMCTGCFSYSVADLCTHRSSDHNFYGVCKGILSPGAFSRHLPNGLLYDIPKEVTTKYPLLPRLIHECSETPGGRIEAATQLIEILGNF